MKTRLGKEKLGVHSFSFEVMFLVYHSQYCSSQSLVPKSEDITLVSNILYPLSWNGLTPLNRMAACLSKVNSQDCVLFFKHLFFSISKTSICCVFELGFFEPASESYTFSSIQLQEMYMSKHMISTSMPGKTNNLHYMLFLL